MSLRACSVLQGHRLSWRAQQWNMQGWPQLTFFKSLFKYVNIMNRPRYALNIVDIFFFSGNMTFTLKFFYLKTANKPCQVHHSNCF